MDVKVKEEVPDDHEDNSDQFFNCDIVKEESTIQAVNVPMQRIETVVNVKEEVLDDSDQVIDYDIVKEETKIQEVNVPATNEDLMNLESKGINSKVDAKQEHICEDCGKIFPKSLNLKRHMRAHNEKGNFHCTICSKTFKYKSNLKKHGKTHIEDPIECSICKRIIKNSNILKDHIKRQHEIKIQYECEKCGRYFSTKYHLKIHDKRFHDSSNDERKPLTCPFCNMIFKNSYNHKRHVELHSESLECKICFRKFKKRYSLKSHMGIHNPPKETFACGICNKSFRLKEHLKHHQKTHLSSEIGALHNCIYCSKSFKKRNGIESHMKTHHRGLPRSKGATPSCTICKEVYANLEDLKKHVVIHRLKNRFECAICGAKTKHKYLLEKHIRRMHLRIPDIRDKKDTECPVCSKMLARRHLKAHMMRHSVQRPFACDPCGKTYKSKAELKRHNIVSHVAIKKKEIIRCSYCEEIFLHKNIASLHTRNHHRGLPLTAEGPPFKCTVCEKSYDVLDELKDHVTIHKEDFKCAICAYTFCRKDSLKRHIEKIHLRKKSTKEGKIHSDTTTDEVVYSIIEIDDIKVEVDDI